MEERDRLSRKRDRLARMLQVASILYTRGSGEQGVAATEIAALTNVNVRTVYRDLKALEDELDLPIFAAERGFYGIERKAFLPPLQLSLAEAIVLFLAARLIARWSDESDQAVIGAFVKLADLLPQPIARHVTATMVVVAEQRTDERFTRVFTSVARAWADGRVLEIIYDSGSGASRTTRVRPYLLEPSAAGRSIYLIGWDETADAMRTYKVERIRQAIVTTDTYDIPEDFSADGWLANSWGIWSSDGTPLPEIVLHFAPDVAARVRETIWHRSQVLVDLPDGGIELRVRVAGLVEIRPWILSWGNSVEVIEPTELRNEVAERLRGAAARYA